VVETRGGFFGEGSAQEISSQELLLRTLPGLMGITNIAFLRDGTPRYQ
jgi:FMN-dependent NADH-azoreductase